MELGKAGSNRLIGVGPDDAGSDRSFPAASLLDDRVPTNGQTGVNTKNEHMFGSIGEVLHGSKEPSAKLPSSTHCR